jgi:hypothetical protein
MTACLHRALALLDAQHLAIAEGFASHPARRDRDQPIRALALARAHVSELNEIGVKVVCPVVLDDAEAEVLESTPSLSEYIPERAPSPWMYENGERCPKPEVSDRRLGQLAAARCRG